jgi:probable F420-dependent oxidoreductase
MTVRSFRFGVSLSGAASLSEWQDRAREAEDLGYDVLQVPDHLRTVSPFIGLLAAAEVTSMGLGTYVLNAGVCNPAYLARDVAYAWRFTGGRFELGMGAGYVPDEFTAVGRSFGTPGSRLRTLDEVLTETRKLLADEADAPQPPVMIAGSGDRILALAARTADIVSFPIFAGFGAGEPEEVFAGRVQSLRNAAGDRFADIELNLFVGGVGPTVADIDLSVISRASGKSPAELAEQPGILVGSARQIADTLLRYRDEWGISYIGVLQDHMKAFAEVIPLLR